MKRLNLVLNSWLYNLKSYLSQAGWSDITVLIAPPNDYSKIVLPQNYVSGQDMISTPCIVVKAEIGAAVPTEIGGEDAMSVDMVMEVFGSNNGERNNLAQDIYEFSLKRQLCYDSSVFDAITGGTFPSTPAPTSDGVIEPNINYKGKIYVVDNSSAFWDLKDVLGSIITLNTIVY